MRPPPRLTEVGRYPITAGVALLAIVVSVASWTGRDVSPLFETAMIRRGELWRLVTCILPHANFLHLAFNLYWLWVFGTLVERTFGPVRTAGLILLFAVASNAAEYAFSTGGIGLSGVGYGLFGMLWVLSSRDERFSDAVDRGTIQLFVVWFFICIGATLANLMRVGNIAHGAGAVVGIAAGLAVARPDRRIAVVSGIVVLVALPLCAATFWRPALNLSASGGADEARLGYDALVHGRNQEAVRWLSDAVVYRNARPGFWNNLGIAYDRLNDNPDAMRALMEAAKRGDVAAQRFIGMLYLTGGRGLPIDEALAFSWLRKAAAQNDPEALNDLAWTFATTSTPARRNPAAALEYARKAVELTKDHPRATFLDTLAEALYVNGQTEEAVKVEEQAIALATPAERAEFQPNLAKYRSKPTT